MDSQLRAIETINTNLAVNAGAGTGKTKVLTERFVHILENGHLVKDSEIEAIVAITFTKKATEEMIERIRKRVKDNFPKGEKWRKFYRDMEKANISTIHSFCAKLLRENPVEAEIDPLFEVLEEYTSKELLVKAIDNVLNSYLDTNPEFFKLILDFKLNRINDIYGDYVDLYNSIRTVGLSIKDVKKITLENLDNLSINKEDINLIKTKTLYLMGKARKNSKIYKYQENENWTKLREDNYTEDELILLVESLNNSLGSIKGEESVIDELKDTIDSVLICKDASFKRSYEMTLDSLIDIDKAYSNEKRNAGALDYDDLQIKVLDLLDDKAILKKYQQKYRYIMIDEFQDINELQKKIFYKLSSYERPLDRNNLFVVGDPKQSIYAFRGADIDVFYEVIDDMKKISSDNVITLDKNYRSVNTVINFINGVFERLMINGYDRLESVNKSLNKVDIEVLDNKEIEDKDEATIYEARLIAKKIKQMVETEDFQYKDFAILFRTSTRNYYYEEALKEYGVPFHNSSSKRFFYRREVLDIINGLKAISNPYDSISMIGFLRGPMVGLSDDTIFYLMANKGENLYESMEKTIELVADEKEKIKLTKAYSKLNYFYSIKGVLGVSDLLGELIDKTYFYEIHLLKEDGKQALANINKFFEILKDFEATSNKSLEHFIDYIEKIRLEDKSEEIISAGNAVSLLTIHKSKGLQFPVVIIPELSRDIQNRFPRILFGKDSGIGVKFNNSRGIYDQIRLREAEKLDEEKKRVMYVAMTRAESKLILGNLGKEKGYKKMLKDYLNTDDYKLIESIEMELSGSKNSLATFDTSKGENLDLKDYPNLINFKDKSTSAFNRYSISQFLKFKECKRKYYLTHINSLDFPKIITDNKKKSIVSGIDIGNILHKFCQLYDETKESQLLLKNISQSYGIEFNASIYEIFKPYINNYKNYYHHNDYDKVYIEKPFSIKIDAYYMSGVIDRINLTGDDIEIVDIKTNKLYNKADLVKQYTPQLRFYSYVVKKALNKTVKASILFLENGEKVEIDVREEKIQDTMRDLQEFFDFVNSKEDIESYTKATTACKMCLYNKLCNLVEVS